MKVYAALILFVASLVHVNSFACIKSTSSVTSCTRMQKSSLYAAAAGKSKSSSASSKSSKKKSEPTKGAAPVVEVVTVRKGEIVSAIAEKTGMTKTDSETALSAILDVISEVRRT